MPADTLDVTKTPEGLMYAFKILTCPLKTRCGGWGVAGGRG
jgi:hypothetical protein